MRSLNKLWFLLVVLIAALGVIGACSDDDDGPTDPGEPTDTTAPQVVGVHPDPGQIGVAVDDSVHVIFSEAMDPASAAGEITVTPGSGVGHTWYTDRVLAIGHADWDEGVEVNVTIGDGLADEAGNTLAAPYTFSFNTVNTTELTILSTSPASNATGVNRDAPIILRFSADINLGTVGANVTISDNPIMAADYDFTVNDADDGVVILDPDDTLPAETVFTVTVGTGVQSWGGLSLAEPYVFTFTTGVDVDTTPPTVVSTVPANGDMSIAADQGFFSMTFSEPINPETLEPARWNLAFYFLMEALESEPVWSDGGSTFTIPLPSPLPDGMPIVITFDDFADLAGNVQTTAYEYEVAVAGTPDYTPVIDGRQWYAEGEWSEGEIGNDTPISEGWLEYVAQLDVQEGDTYRISNYPDPDFDPAEILGYEEFTKTASALQWIGFEDYDVPPPVNKESFDSPVDILPLPIAVGQWNDQTTVTIEGEGEYRATLTGTVVDQADYSIPESDHTVFIKDAWRVVRVLDVEFYDEPEWVSAFVETDTVYYAPTLGDVFMTEYSEEIMEGTWYREATWFFPFFGEIRAKGKASGWR